MAGAPVKDTAAMIAGMAPVRDAEIWHFCTTSDPDLGARAAADALTVFAEDEGTSMILPDGIAHDLRFETDMPMTRITLSVHSALDGVGLTAAVAEALAQAGIPCNMVAAYHHDHAFVPAELADKALEVLMALADRTGA